MALNLKRLAKVGAVADEASAPDTGGRSPAQKEKPLDPTYGRGRLPPPRGSDWGPFVDWACEDSFLTEDDKQLAFNGWMGRLRWVEEAEPSKPRM